MTNSLHITDLMHIIYPSLLVIFFFRRGLVDFIDFTLLVVLIVSLIVLILNLLQDTSDMVVPFKRSISHTEVYFGLLPHVAIIGLLRDFHGSVEVLCTLIIVSFLSEDLSKLHLRWALTLSVLELVREFQVPLNEHLHFVLVHLGVDLVSSHFTEVSNCNRLTSDTTHLDCVTKCKLMINRGFLEITYTVINDTKIYMC